MSSIHEQPSRVEPTKLRLDQAPILYRSLEEVEKRLGVPVFSFYNEPVSSFDCFSFVLTRLRNYVKETYPGWMVTALVKAYEEVLHGQRARGVYLSIEPNGENLHRLPEIVAKLSERTERSWTGGVSGIVRIERDYSATPSGNSPWREFTPVMFLPMCDFQVLATAEIRSELYNLGFALATYGFTGTIIRSGDWYKGSYHYLGDFLVPYQPGVWQVLGRFLEILSPEEDSAELRDYGLRLKSTGRFIDAAVVAREILDKFPSETKTSPWVDPRWVARSILEPGGPILRTQLSKSYRTTPLEIALIEDSSYL